MSFRLLSTVALAGLALIQTPAAQASMTSYSDTVTVLGQEYLGVLELPLDAPGRYQVTVTDLKWFNVPLDTLKFTLFTATAPIASSQTAGTIEFFHASEEKVFLQLYAKPAAPRYAGLIGVQETAVVPLPASLWLLGSGLAALFVPGGLRALARSIAAFLVARAAQLQDVLLQFGWILRVSLTAPRTTRAPTARCGASGYAAVA
jgi:hypothetical protein